MALFSRISSPAAASSGLCSHCLTTPVEKFLFPSSFSKSGWSYCPDLSPWGSHYARGIEFLGYLGLDHVLEFSGKTSQTWIARTERQVWGQGFPKENWIADTRKGVNGCWEGRNNSSLHAALRRPRKRTLTLNKVQSSVNELCMQVHVNVYVWIEKCVKLYTLDWGYR